MAEIRRFDWTEFPAADRGSMIELVVIARNLNGTYGWSCWCGAEADEFEDHDAADTNADEHLRAVRLTTAEEIR